jgi:glycosyltransferase involved in cell wall biosynthesis
MKVGLEVSAMVSRQPSGVGNYVANLLSGLQQVAGEKPELDLLYFSNRSQLSVPGQTAQPAGIEIYPYNRLPVRSAWLQFGLPDSLARTQPDLGHFPNYLAPVLRKLEMPYLVTMHDMSIYRCPQYQPLKTVAVHRAIVPKVAREARLIITVSESARQDILHYLKVPAGRVRVVPGMVGWPFGGPPLLPAAETALTMDLRQRYNLPFPYLLSVGTFEPRKNHARLIEAFSELVRQERLPHHLVLAGPPGWKEGGLTGRLRRSGLSERVHFLGYVPTADLPALYRNAQAFAFPSLYEGFGLPVLEAMTCGTPCLISNDPALREVSGAAALVVDPTSSQQIAAGLHRLLTDQALRTDLRERGLARAAEFSVNNCARQTYRLYQEVFAEVSQKPAYFLGAADSGSEPVVDAGVAPAIFDLEKISAPFSFAGLPAPALEPSPLERAILQTVLYADIFDFPLTLPELERFLIGQLADRATIEDCLTGSNYLQERLSRRGDFVALRGREGIFGERDNQQALVRRQWQAARRWGRVLQLVPFLRGAIVTGGLAAGSARPKDDIDLLLLVEPGRLWACRALVIGVVRLARLTGTELCPNYLMALNDEPLTIQQRNLYTARELAGMRLLFGETAYQRLLSLNPWLADWLPNAATLARTATPPAEKRPVGETGPECEVAGRKAAERLAG